MLSSKANAFLIYTCLRSVFKGIVLLIVKELATNNKIIISDTGVHSQHWRKRWLLCMNGIATNQLTSSRTWNVKMNWKSTTYRRYWVNYNECVPVLNLPLNKRKKGEEKLSKEFITTLWHICKFTTQLCVYSLMQRNLNPIQDIWK